MTTQSGPGRAVHIIGAGLAGLAAALALSKSGRSVCIHEAAPQAGGRCRSFHDATLGRRIDNGNHLLLSANRAALDYLAETGAADTLVAGDGPIPFLDLSTGDAWKLDLGTGGLLRRLAAPVFQVPGARCLDAVAMVRLATARPETSVLDALGPGPLMERFWRPFTTAVLNTDPEEASAALLRGVLGTLLFEGGDGLIPLTARDGLSESFVDPCLAALAARGVPLGLGRRLRAIDLEGNRATALHFQGESIALADTDDVVIAVPATAASALLPGLTVPAETSAIVNAHFILEAPGQVPGGGVLIGLVGGTAEWVFLRGDLASITVSAADTWIDRPAEELLDLLWRDTATALGQPDAARPPGRIVKERRATFRQTPEAMKRRPVSTTAWRNLVLAGDWTDTGLPATIEGAIRSGGAAAQALMDARE